jgi:hypothetical protein
MIEGCCGEGVGEGVGEDDEDTITASPDFGGIGVDGATRKESLSS